LILVANRKWFGDRDVAQGRAMIARLDLETSIIIILDPSRRGLCALAEVNFRKRASVTAAQSQTGQ
jgi:hypothetical protein